MFKQKPRRVPRKIASGDEDDENITQTVTPASSSSIVRRPNSKPKKSTSLRTSISLDNDADLDEPSFASHKLQQTPLARIALERHAGASPKSDSPLPFRSSEDRPSYNADYLAELKSSTPIRPKNTSIQKTLSDDDLDAEDLPPTLDIDIASKYGSSAITDLTSTSSAFLIPTNAEVQEKKERRRRLRHEQDFISLDDNGVDEADVSTDEDDRHRTRSLIIPADEVDLKSKYGETRLVHEDEDIAEGFDSFVDDPGLVTLGKRAARHQEASRRKEIEAQIRSAQAGEGVLDSDDEDADSVDEEDAARIAAYEAAQTRAGTSGTKSSRQREKEREESLRRRLERPPKITPIPELSAVKAMFRERAKAKSDEVWKQEAMLEQLQRERMQLDDEESKMQELLKEAGERFERLNAGLMEVETNTSPPEQAQAQPDVALAIQQQGRGLESMGGMSSRPKDEWDDT